MRATSYARLALCATAVQLPACIIVAGDDHGLGTLTVEWTVQGLREPSDCAAFGVDRLELALFTPSGRLVDEIEPFCESFGVSLDLVEGLYFGDATLVDSFDDPVTFTQPLSLEILEATELAVSIDFPFASFL